MKHLLLLLGAASICGGLTSGCTYNTYVPPPQPPQERVIHHYSTPATPTTKSAAVGGSGGSAESFQAVTPPHSYSQ